MLINTKATRIVGDGLSHCCSTPNPLHQTWAHTATHRTMGNRQHCNSLAHILATIKNNSEYHRGKCYSPVLYCVDYGQPRQKWKVFPYFHHVQATVLLYWVSLALLYTFRIYLGSWLDDQIREVDFFGNVCTNLKYLCIKQFDDSWQFVIKTSTTNTPIKCEAMKSILLHQK